MDRINKSLLSALVRGRWEKGISIDYRRIVYLGFSRFYVHFLAVLVEFARRRFVLS